LFVASSIERTSPRLLLAAALIAAGVSIYQGCLGVLATAAALRMIFVFTAESELDKTRAVRCCLHVAVALAAGGLAYALIHELILSTSGITPPNAFYSVSFDLAFWERWDFIQSAISRRLLGSGGLLPEGTVLIFLMAVVVLLIDRARRRLSPASLARGAALALAITVAPFSVMFLHQGGLPARAATGLGVSWLAVFAMLATSPSRWTRRWGIASAAVIVTVFVFQNNQMFYSQHLVAQADRLMISRIAERIDSLDAGDRDGGPPTVVMVGSYSHPSHPGISRNDSVLGRSNFEWDGGNHRRMKALAASVGVDHYDWRPPAQLGPPDAVERIVRERRPWPALESVFVHGDETIVWLGARRKARAPSLSWASSLLSSK